MPVYRALPTALLALNLVISGNLQAAEVKDNTQQAKQGQQSAALDRINAYLKSYPTDAQAMFTKGITLADLNRRDEAIKTFTEITERYPALPEPYNNLAVLYAESGQYDKARKALEAALRTHPSYATAHDNLAGIYARMASEAYDKALQLDKNTSPAPTNKLAMIRDLTPITNKPVMVASRSPESGPLIKEIPKPLTIPPTFPVRPADPVKTAEVKPVDTIKSEPVKPAEPAKLPETKAPEAKVAQAPLAESKLPETKPTEPKLPETEKADSDNIKSTKDVTATVQSWAKAWSSKNTDKYLGNYADNFETPNAESRKEWEENRRERIAKPAAIKVEITNLRVKMEEANRARVHFKQTYRAGSTVMRTTKTMVLKNSGGKWLIEQELTER
jgi:hypothetical protein